MRVVGAFVMAVICCDYLLLATTVVINVSVVVTVAVAILNYKYERCF